MSDSVVSVSDGAEDDVSDVPTGIVEKPPVRGALVKDGVTGDVPLAPPAEERMGGGDALLAATAVVEADVAAGYDAVKV